MKRAILFLLLLGGIGGSPSIAQVITQGNSGVNAQTGTTYTIALADSVKLLTFSNAAGVAVTLPVASTFGAGVVFQVKNVGAGSVTITPTTSTIDGAATLVFDTGDGRTIYNDGTNYFTDANFANKPVAADSIRYVTNSGNDSNDGLSWGSSKLTIAAACASIANQDATCTLSLGYGTLYVADNFVGSYPAGFLTGAATALKIIGPAYIQADSSLISANGSILAYASDAYMALFDGGFQIAIQAGPRSKQVYPITAISVTANVATVTGLQSPNLIAGDVVYLSNTRESFLNGQKLTVLAGGLTSTTFTANFTHANFSNASDQGNGATKTLLATSTITWPDLTGGTSTPASGVALAVTGAVDASASGHCLYYGGNTATGLGGAMIDSGIGCNNNMVLSANTFSYSWKNGANFNFLDSQAISATTVENLPAVDQGNVLVSPAAFPPSTNSGVSRVTADFTDASSTALQTITGLSFVLPANRAYNYSVECHLAYTQATVVADAFGIQAASLAPTNIFATAQIQTNSTTAFTGGTLATLATTTATNISTFTPTTTTANKADIYAMVENPSGVANTINIMVSQSTAGDLIVIKRGSYCMVY